MKLFGSHEPAHERPTSGLENRTIGRILVDMGKLRDKDVRKVFNLHRRKGMRFGEAARRLRLVEDADIQYALSIQFNYPYVKSGQGALGRELVTAHDPFDAQSEAVRDLRTQLVMQWASDERKVVGIISPGAQEGRSYLAANLAVAFAQLGAKTLLIDADLREPRQHRIFGLNGGRGLAQVLSGRGGLGNAEQIPYFETLSVLAAGPAPPNPLELLSRPEFPHLLTDARKDFAIVLIDTSAAARGADAKVVSSRVDGVLMVARQDHTKLADLDRLHRALTGAGAQVIGTVLNRI